MNSFISECKKCGKVLTSDEIGFYKKMVNRGSTEFECIECLSSHFGITVDAAREMIENFRKSGCSLFAKNK